MKIIDPSVEIVRADANALKHIERCGRVCYQSEHKIGEGTAENFGRNIIARDHGAVLEHSSFTARIICDRGVSHEIVRHRMASYCQESTRYCNYSKDGFGSEISVIAPCYLQPETEGWKWWEESCKQAEAAYFAMLNWGCSPQEARAVLPTSLKTELIMTANIREWRHFFRVRCDKAAHPQMREIAMLLLIEAHARIPICFDDIWGEIGGGMPC